jgi:hypothetical protein
MTNEEWIEELYMLSAQIGKFHQIHDKVDEIKKKYRDLTLIEVTELAYIELKREYEEEILKTLYD